MHIGLLKKVTHKYDALKKTIPNFRVKYLNLFSYAYQSFSGSKKNFYDETKRWFLKLNLPILLQFSIGTVFPIGRLPFPKQLVLIEDPMYKQRIRKYGRIAIACSLNAQNDYTFFLLYFSSNIFLLTLEKIWIARKGPFKYYVKQDICPLGPYPPTL